MTNAAQGTDLELLDAWAIGDYRAASALVDRHFDGLCRFIRGKVRGDADEMLQRTLRMAVRTRARCRTVASVRAHLFAIARNLLIAGQEVEALREGDAPGVPCRDEPTPSIEPSELSGPRVRAALRRLPLDHQIALELHYWERFDRAELAQVLGVPEDLVPQQLGRGMELLRRELARV